MILICCNIGKKGLISVIETADGALAEVTAMLQRMNELAVQASNGTLNDDDRELIQKEVSELKDEINRVSKSTEFNSQPLLDGFYDLKAYTDNIDYKCLTYSREVPADKYNFSSISWTTDADGNYEVSVAGGNASANKYSPFNAALVDDVITITGAQDFAREYDIPVIGLPGTIDNDLYGTDTTIGYDTALNTIVECVDKIRDTANSHDRIFFIEVMGRDAGFLAQNSAIAAGAEAAIIPEDQTDIDQLEQFIAHGCRKSKNSSIVIVSESKKDGGAMHYAERVKKEYPGYDVRVTILGHLQRGGSPSAHDRILASRLGYASIQALLEGQRNIMVGISNDKIVYVPISRAAKQNKPINKELIDVLAVLSI